MVISFGRWETCVSDTNTDFPHALGYEYVKMYFDADAKQNVRFLHPVTEY